MNKSRPLIRAGLIVVLTALISSVSYADFESGLNYFKAGKYPEAAAEFQQIVNDSPDYHYGFYVLGLSQLKMNKPQDAIENLRKAVDLNGDKFEYHYGLAQAYLATGNARRVVEALRPAEALISDPTRIPFHTVRGQANYQLGKWSDAITDLEKVVRSKPTDGIYTQIGTSYYKLGYYDKAAAAFKKSIGIRRTDAAEQYLALALTNQAQESKSDAMYAEALQAAKAYRAKHTSDPEAANLVGRAALGAGNYDLAVQTFDEVLKMKPNHCPAMMNKGKAYVGMSKWKSAEGPLSQVQSCDSKIAPMAQETLAFVYRKQASETKGWEQQIVMYKKSLAAYEKAKSMKPSSSIDRAINEIRQNIETIQFNKSADAAEAAQRAEQERLDREFEEKQKRTEEWEKKGD